MSTLHSTLAHSNSTIWLQRKRVQYDEMDWLEHVFFFVCEYECLEYNFLYYSRLVRFIQIKLHFSTDEIVEMNWKETLHFTFDQKEKKKNRHFVRKLLKCLLELHLHCFIFHRILIVEAIYIRVFSVYVFGCSSFHSQLLSILIVSQTIFALQCLTIRRNRNGKQWKI